MITPDRTVNQGENITLWIEVRNFDGVLVDSDPAPTVDIFPQHKDPRNSTTDDADAVVTDASPTKEAQGIYKYTYSVAADAHVGIWFDRWSVTLDGVSSTAVLQFQIQSTDSTSPEDNAGTQVLLNDNVVIVTVTDDVKTTDGASLPDDFQYYFTTKYSVLYSTSKRLRLRGGGYMKSVPDDTLNLALFEASLEADTLVFGMAYPPGLNPSLPTAYSLASGKIAPTYNISTRKAGPYLTLAKQNYAECRALLSILSNSLGPAARRKRLADFSVDYGDAHLRDFFEDIRNECEEWERVLNSGGYLHKKAGVPGRIAVKGRQRPAETKPRIGRRIDRDNTSPATNTKARIGRTERWHHTFNKRY